MATSLRTSAAGGSSSGTSDRTCTITPAVGDLFVVFCSVSVNTNATPTCSDNNGGTYTRIRHAFFNASASSLSAFVRDQLLTNTTSTVVTVATGANDSGNVVVLAVSGMERVGTLAVLQSARQVNGTAGTTPAPAFAATTLTKNFVCGCVGNGSNPAGMTAPVAIPERQDVGFASPAIGLEVVSVNSGVALTTVTWGGNSATAFASVVIELDSNPNDLVADVGTFDEAGQAVTFAVTTTADAAAFSLAGQDATFGIATIAAEAAFTESGQAVLFGIAAPEDTGAYSLSGQAVLFGITSPEGTGAFTLVGQDVSLLHALVAGTGAFVLAGQDVGLLYSATETMVAGTGSYSVSGQSVNLIYSGDVAGVPVITIGPQTKIYAALTRLTLSGQDSYYEGPPAAPDCAMTAAAMYWDLGDGTFATGFNVRHVWATSGTKTVELLVKWENGTTSSTTRLVTVLPTPTFTAFTKYVNDSTGLDSNNGNSTGTPYKTIQKAIDVWTSFRGSAGSFVDPGAIALNKGDTFAFAGLDQIDFGPLLITAYGAGAAPIIVPATGKSFDIGRTTHDDNPDNSCWAEGVDVRWAAEHIDNLVGMGHQASQFSNGTVVNGGFYCVGAGSTIESATQSKGWLYGLYPNGAYLHVASSSFTGNGHDSTFHHQIYGSGGLNHSGFTSVSTDATGTAGALDGFKTSGSKKVYFADCVASNSSTAFDVGGNPGEDCQDLVYERCTSTDCTFQGYWTNYCTRISVRNARQFNGTSACVIEVQPATSGIRGLEVLNGTFSAFTGIFLRTSAGTITDVVVQNAIATKTNAGFFYDITSLANLAEMTVDHNHYYRTGGSSAGFARVAGVTLTFADWQAAPYNMDAGSTFSDPLLVSTSDLHLQAGSPAINVGATLGLIITDFTGAFRPIGAGYDRGAYEFGGSGSPYSMNADVGAFAVADTPTGATHNTRFKVATLAGAGTFTLDGFDVLLSNATVTPHSMTAETGVFLVTRQNANLIWSNQQGDVGSSDPISFIIRFGRPVRVVQRKDKQGRLRWEILGD